MRPRRKGGGGLTENQTFFDSLAFQLCRRPAGERWYSPAGFVPGYKYAAWEALKDDQTYGGQLIREELDEFVMQSLYSMLGLGASLVFLWARILSKLYEAALLRAHL